MFSKFNSQVLLRDVKFVGSDVYNPIKQIFESEADDFVDTLSLLNDEKTKQEITKYDFKFKFNDAEEDEAHLLDDLKSKKLNKLLFALGNQTDTLAVYNLLQIYKERPSLFYDINVIGNKIALIVENKSELTPERVNDLLDYLENNHIVGINAAEIALPLHELLLELNCSYTPSELKTIVDETFDDICGEDFLRYCYKNNPYGFLFGEQNYYTDRQKIDLLVENDFSLFVNILMTATVYKLSDYVLSEVLLKFVEHKGIENVMSIFYRADADMFDDNFKYYLASFINNNSIDYLLTFLKYDLRKRDFFEKLLQIFVDNELNNTAYGDKVISKTKNFIISL